MNFKQLEKYASIIQDARTKCSCGHSLTLPPHIDKVICRWCGNYVFKTKKAEFEYRIKEAMHNGVESKKNK